MENIAYERKLEAVRSMPAGSEAERAFKKEAARDLRIETYLSWAEAVKSTVDLLSENPLATTEELQTLFDYKTLQVSRPKVLGAFIRHLDSARRLTKSALGWFRQELDLPPTTKPVADWPEAEKEKVGVLIYQRINKAKKPPQGSVQLIETPIAVGISVDEDADFKVLDRRGNINGFYLGLGQPITGPIRFPLIAIKGGDSFDFIAQHEVGHGFNEAIVTSLQGQGDIYRKTVWGGGPKKEVEVMARNLTEYLESDGILQFLDSAKDELIAEFLAKGSFSILASLRRRHGVYDYLDKTLARTHLPKFFLERREGSLENIWKKYVDELIVDVAVPEKITRLYDDYFLTGRRALFAYVLAQYPVAEWKGRLAADFLVEMLAFRRAENRARRFGVRISRALAKGQPLGLEPDERKARRAILTAAEASANELWSDLLHGAKEHPTKSFYPAIRGLNARMSELERETEGLLE